MQGIDSGELELPAAEAKAEEGSGMGLYAAVAVGVGACEARGERGMERCVREESQGQEKIQATDKYVLHMSGESRRFKVGAIAGVGDKITAP
jgi:hypothetical protein